MAFDKKDKTNLESLAQSMGRSKEGSINMPAGKDENEIEYSVMDLMAGLCSSAMFINGSNKNKDSVKTFLSDSKKSYLYSINQSLTAIVNYLKAKNGVTNNLQNNVISAINKSFKDIISDNAINVKLSNEYIKQQEQESLLGIENLKKIIIDSINSSNINNVNNDNKTSEISTKILLDIQNIDTLKKLINEISFSNEVREFDKLLNSLDWINKILEKISNSKFKTTISGLSSLKDLLSNIKELIIDEKELDNLSTMMTKLSDISLNHNNVESVNEIFILLDNLNKSLPDEKEIGNIKTNITTLTKIFNNDKESFIKLYEAIQSVFDKSKLTIENVKGLNDVLNSVITIISFDKDINTDVIYELEQLLTDGGTVRNIIKDINTISQLITVNSSKSLSILNSYISSLTAIGDIGLIAKINMMLNFEFFEHYVSKKIPSLINGINENFKDILSSQNLEVLESLEDYFRYIKNIGFVSVKDMIKMTLNIEFLRHFALKEIKNLIDEISKEFGQMDDSKSSLSNISSLFANLMSIVNVDTGKIDEQRENLSNIRKLIFGDTLFGQRLGAFGNLRYSSISQIIEMINKFGKKLGDTTNNVNNIKKLMLLLNKNIISLKLDETGVKTNIEILTLVHKKELPTLEKSIKYIKKIGEDYKDLDLKDFVNVLEKIKNVTDKNSVREIFNKLFVDTDTTKRLLNTYAAFSNLKLLTKTLIWLGKIDESVIEESLKPLIKLAEGLNVVINKFDFDEDKLNNAITVLKQLELFLVKTSLLILSVLVLSLFKLEDVFKYVLGMSVLLGGVAIILHLLESKEFKDIDNKLKTIQDITKMLVILSLSLAISLKIMQGVDWTAFIQLGVGVIVSLAICGAIVFIINQFKDEVFKSIPVSKDLAILMFTLSISLGLGAFIAQQVSSGQIATFGLLLALLIAAVSLPLLVLSKGSSVLFKGGKDLGILILMVSMSLALGSFIAQFIPQEHIVTFGTILGGLIVALAVPLFALSIFGKAMIQGGKDLGIIMLYSTASLLIGGLFIMIGGEKLVNAIKQFGVILGLFVSGIIIAYGIASALGKNGMEHAKLLNNIILISAATLLIGGALFKIKGFKEAVIDFALTLGIFIAGISIAIGIAAAIAKDGLKYAWQIALIVAITSLAMTLGPLLLKDHDVKYSDVFLFLLNSVLFIGAIGSLAYLAGQFKSQIGIGLVIVGTIGLLIFGMAWVFSKSYELLNPIKWSSLMGDLALAMLTLTVIGVLIGVIGTLGTMVLPFLGVGAAIFVGIELIIIGLAKSVSMVAKAINDLKKLGSIGDMGKLLKPFGNFIEAAISNLTVNPLKLAKLKLASSAMGSVGSMISSLAKGIKEYASLKVPMYDANGKEIGSRQLKRQDFRDAANRVTTIITTVGGAIMDLMTNATGKDKELMKELMQPAGLFGQSTKFGKLVKSLSSIGGLIKTYAEAVQNYAQLKVPQTDNNGNIIEGKFRTLKEDDFINAGIHIYEIMTLMAKAVADTYKGNEELFSGTWVSSSPIAKVTKAMKNIGPIIASLAKSVQDYAQLKIPQTDKNGNIIEGKFELLDKPKFDDAKENIKDIITAIGNAIVEAVGEDKNGIFKSGDNSKAATAVKAISNVSNVIGAIANNISSYATGKFPVLKYVDGKLITDNEPIIMDDKKWTNAKDNIKRALVTIGSAIVEALDDDDIEDLLTGDDSEKLATNLNTIMTTITKMANSINGLVKLELKFESLDDIVKAIGRYIGLVTFIHIHAKTYNYNDVKDSLDGYSKFISQSVQICKDILSVDYQKGYNIFKTSIENVTTAISKINNTDKFANHVQSIKDYVQTIDSIDISKVESLTSLIDAVNSLGANMKNLDEFTNVIANKLSVVLEHLVNKLDEAKKSIKDADTLHAKRKSLIDNSVKTIKELMAQEMIVKIEQEESTASGGFTPTGGEGVSSSSGTSMEGTAGGDATQITQTTISQGTSGGNSGVSQVADSSELAVAIAREIRKILAERNIGS